MKNVTSLKATKNESPKTPGGISKSLLTPCRRVGLSRKWKKVGPSPFVSPLTTSNSITTEPKIEKKETRKRKVRTPTEEIDEPDPVSPQTPLVNNERHGDDTGTPICTANSDEIVTTPLRHVEIPRRKKSKPLTNHKNNIISPESTKIENNSVNPIFLTPSPAEVKDIAQEKSEIAENVEEHAKHAIKTEQVQTPVRSKSKTKIKKTLKVEKVANEDKCGIIDTPDQKDLDLQQENVQYEVKERSPNELTKKCIVVIQKKIFKTDKKVKKIQETKTLALVDNVKDTEKSKKDTVSQTIFDSDSDEIPLCQLNNQVDKNTEPVIINLDEDDDFTEKNVPVKNLADKNTSTGGLKPTKKLKTKAKPRKTVESKLIEANLSNSFDDDDFEMDKRTILIKKSYEKVAKPLKARSTGSITQRDIDDLKARIESKKKMLMAKAMTEDTKELRTLIKEWQKGCQDALMELMELMKTKFPEKQSMDYAEMLQTLKIPAQLVGYDEENDCFTTPDDEGIILNKFKDL